MPHLRITVPCTPDMCFSTGMSDVCITVTGMSDEDRCQHWPLDCSDSQDMWLTSTEGQQQGQMFWRPAPMVPAAGWDATLFMCSDIDIYLFLCRRLRAEGAVDQLCGTRRWRQVLTPVDETKPLHA
eukprot:6039000-Amphidinium_carterae.2